ncbi:hypothetical protein BH18THE2_BH18THE2_12020 [soil metagenome]
MEKKVIDMQQLLNYYNSPGKVFLDISKEQPKNINTFFINSVTEDDLTKMLQYMCNSPIRFIDLFSSCKNKYSVYLVTHLIMNPLPKMKTKKRDFNYAVFMI